MQKQTSFLRRRYLEEVQLLEDGEGKETQEEEEEAQQHLSPASNRLAFSETSSGRLVFIVSGSLFSVLVAYFFLHDCLRDACCYASSVKSRIEDDDDDKDGQEPKRDMTTKTGSGTVDDLSKSEYRTHEDSGNGSASAK